eukprot:1110673-Rhodomonas_salina.3
MSAIAKASRVSVDRGSRACKVHIGRRCMNPPTVNARKATRRTEVPGVSPSSSCRQGRGA